MTARATALRSEPTLALHAETSPLEDAPALIPLTEPRSPALWMRRGEGIAGIGEAVRLEFSGPSRIADASAAWRHLVAASTVEDAVDALGTGLVAFGAFTFSGSSPTSSVLIVPEIVIGRRDGRTWITRIRHRDDRAFTSRLTPSELGDEYRLQLIPGALKPDAFADAVRIAVDRIRDRELSKVVLARDLTGHLPLESDVRRTLMGLSLGYPDCWTFAVDGLIGSSPETLTRVERGAVSARVLAGTVSRGSDAASDHDAAMALSSSPKDQGEHRFAVQGALEALRPHMARLSASPLPFTLKLPNLWHLATDIEGTLADHSNVFDLVDGLHPTAAVAGTPTEAALRVIAELEPFDRGRYAGPVGWVNAAGDGEWAVALRSAQIDPDGNITACAGCGIVADSDPASELAESTIKFRPITEAFG